MRSSLLVLRIITELELDLKVCGPVSHPVYKVGGSGPLASDGVQQRALADEEADVGDVNWDLKQFSDAVVSEAQEVAADGVVEIASVGRVDREDALLPIHAIEKKIR